MTYEHPGANALKKTHCRMHILRWVQVLITRVQDVLHLDLFRILRAMRILVPLVETCAIAAIGLTALTDES